VGINKIAATAANTTKPNRAVDEALVPGDPQVLVCNGHPFDLIVVQAVVFGQDDFNRVPAQVELSTQPENDFSKPSGLCDWGTLAGDHNDVH